MIQKAAHWVHGVPGLTKGLGWKGPVKVFSGNTIKLSFQNVFLHMFFLGHNLLHLLNSSGPMHRKSSRNAYFWGHHPTQFIIGSTIVSARKTTFLVSFHRNRGYSTDLHNRVATKIQIILHFGQPSKVITIDLRKPSIFYIYDLSPTFSTSSIAI